jgi:NodT family efflux transporter outer membrane factor (OMF) lipoprotein
MMVSIVKRWLVVWTVAALALAASGCTSPIEYVRNGFKVGPNYHGAQASVAPHWIDETDTRVRPQPADLTQWWSVFNDPVLNGLVECAAHQNLSLREAGFRILEARAELGVTEGRLLPQVQTANANYTRANFSGANPLTYNGSFSGNISAYPITITDASGAVKENNTVTGPATFTGPATLVPPVGNSSWGFGMNMAWELDFWGRFRRAVVAAEETLQANCADYNGVMVTLMGDVAKYYVQLRTDQKRIDLVWANVALQRRVLEVARRRFQEGQTNDLDLNQARSTLAQTESQIPLLESDLRAAANRLCVLMGVPPANLEAQLGPGPIPAAPAAVVVGIPADLLRRRPDVCRAERLAAAQAEQIGIAEANFYPIVSINGNLGYSAATFSQLFQSTAFAGAIGPGIQWNILNYGRIRNNMRLQEDKFQELLLVYQRMVLQAAEEAETGMSHFLREQERSKLLDESVAAAQLAVNTVVKQYEAGSIDFTRVSQIEQSLVQQEDTQAASHGQVAQGLIEVYRALGGGWRAPVNAAEAAQTEPPPKAPPPDEEVPLPPPGAPTALLDEAPLPGLK